MDCIIVFKVNILYLYQHKMEILFFHATCIFSMCFHIISIFYLDRIIVVNVIILIQKQSDNNLACINK